MSHKKISRNAPCPCGSGKKYKKCCYGKDFGFEEDEAGNVFHTYSSFARGGEIGLGGYAVLDITPKGRNETINGNMTDWVRHHDRYDDDGSACCHSD